LRVGQIDPRGRLGINLVGGPSLFEWVYLMRRVEIVEEPNQVPYKWIAIDKGTRQSLLRLSDLYQLRDVCHRLEWEVVDVKRARGN
jgi:hypothetical protein